MQTKTRGRRRPAFLDTIITERTTRASEPLPGWKPTDGAKAVLTALDALPRLAASIGMSAGAPDARVEVLPGRPTTIAFSAGGKLKGLFVLPVGEDEARRTLGIPTISTCDIAADAWFEEEREQDILDPHEALAEAQHEAWGL